MMSWRIFWRCWRKIETFTCVTQSWVETNAGVAERYHRNDLTSTIHPASGIPHRVQKNLSEARKALTANLQSVAVAGVWMDQVDSKFVFKIRNVAVDGGIEHVDFRSPDITQDIFEGNCTSWILRE